MQEKREPVVVGLDAPLGVDGSLDFLLRIIQAQVLTCGEGGEELLKALSFELTYRIEQGRWGGQAGN